MKGRAFGYMFLMCDGQPMTALERPAKHGRACHRGASQGAFAGGGARRAECHRARMVIATGLETILNNLAKYVISVTV